MWLALRKICTYLTEVQASHIGSQVLWYVWTGAWQTLLYIMGVGLWLKTQRPEMGKVFEKGFPPFPANQKTELSGHMHESHVYGWNIEWVHNSSKWFRNSEKRYTYNRTYIHRYVTARSVALAWSLLTMNISKACSLRSTLSCLHWFYFSIYFIIPLNGYYMYV